MKQSNNPVDRVVCFDLFDTLVTTGSEEPRYQAVVLDICRQQGIPEEWARSNIYPIVRDKLMTQPNLSYSSMVDQLISELCIDATQEQKACIARAWAEDNEKAEWMEDAESVLSQMRGGINTQVALVSNITGPAWDIIDRKLKVRRRFDELFLSCDKRISKPDPRVWKYFEEKYPRVSSRWMVGNSLPDDINGPFRRGWQVGYVARGKSLSESVERLLLEAPEIERSKNIILDVPLSSEEKQWLSSFGMQLLDGEDLTSRLQEWVGWEILDPETTMLFFPGNGANRVKSYLSQEWLSRWPNQFSIDIKRIWYPGQDPIVQGGGIIDPVMYPEITDAVIVDDAISSGATAKKIKKENEAWFPQASWSVATWTGQRAANTKGLAPVFSCAEVGNRNAKDPLNSISTLLEDNEIAESYIWRNFPDDGDVFLNGLNKMRARRGMNMVWKIR